MQRSSAAAESVFGPGFKVVVRDIRLFVPVRIQLDTALLHAHTAEVFLRFEGIACEIALHANLLRCK